MAGSLGVPHDPVRVEATPIPSHPEPDGSPLPAEDGSGLSLDGFREVLRVPDFRRLFAGQAVSALGDWVGTLAFIAAAQQLTGRQEAVAGVLVLRLIPSFFATPVGGLLSDRWDRKRIMIWSDIARFALLLPVPFVPNIGVLYVVAFAQECFSLVFLPARDASLPNMVREKDLGAANALVMGSSFAGIPLSGPLFAVLAWIGAHYPVGLVGQGVFRSRAWAFAFFFDALTFLVSAAFLARLSIPRHVLSAGEAQEPFFPAARRGARYIAERPMLRGLAYAVTVGMLGGGVLFAIGIAYVETTLGGGEVEFGWLMGLFGVGMVGGFLISQLKPPGGPAWIVRISLLAMGGILIFMGAWPVLWIAYLTAIGFGAAFSVSLIVAMSTVQAETEDAYRGRVMGFVHMLVRGALSIGALGAAGIAAATPDRGIELPLVRFHPDKNQVALIVAGALIVAAAAGVRGRARGGEDAP